MYLKIPVLCLNRNDLIPNKLQDPIHDRLKALQNFLVREGHVALLNTSLGELSLDANVDSPFLTVVPEIGLDSVLEVHDALGIHLPGSLRPVWKLHLPNLGAQNVAEVTVQRCRAARITRSGCALGNREWLLFLNLISDQIDRSTTAVYNQNRIMDLEIQETSLGAKHGSGFRLSHECQPVVVLVPQETSLNGCCPGCSLACIVPNGGDSEVVSNVPLLAVEYLTESLLQLVAHCLAQVEEVVGCDIDLGLPRRKRRQVDRVDVGIAREHQLKLEPLHLLDTRLGIAGGGQSVGNVWPPPYDLLILIVVQDSGDLDGGQQRANCTQCGRIHLLLGLVSCAGPLRNDVFLRLGVGSESESDA